MQTWRRSRSAAHQVRPVGWRDEPRAAQQGYGHVQDGPVVRDPPCFSQGRWCWVSRFLTGEEGQLADLAGATCRLNLTAARRVYLMEPFWNPAVEVCYLFLPWALSREVLIERDPSRTKPSTEYAPWRVCLSRIELMVDPFLSRRFIAWVKPCRSRRCGTSS